MDHSFVEQLEWSPRGTERTSHHMKNIVRTVTLVWMTLFALTTFAAEPSLLQQSSVWRNPKNAAASLTILERNGNTFRGRLQDDANTVGEVFGSVTGDQITWSEYKSIKGSKKSGNAATVVGVISGNRIDFTYRGPKASGTFSLVFEAGSNPSIGGSPTTPPVGSGQAISHKPEQPKILILSEESVNVTGWLTSPLEVSVPGQIWENLNFLKEALRDEAVQKPVANGKTYALANYLCAQMLRYLEERDKFTARGGGDAVLHQKSNLTQSQRDHLTWPQFALENAERAERAANSRNAPKFMNGNALVEWDQRKMVIRREMELAYAQFREALRQSPPLAK